MNDTQGWQKRNKPLEFLWTPLLVSSVTKIYNVFTTGKQSQLESFDFKMFGWWLNVTGEKLCESNQSFVPAMHYASIPIVKCQ